MLLETERRFIASHPVGHLATASAAGVPHVVPVCFAVTESAAYITIDAKPKRGQPTRLKRVRNIEENPVASLVVDRYSDDWSQLGWVMLHGPAEILSAGEEHDHAQSLLCARYPQLARMQIAHLPVIAIRIARTRSWGNLSAAD
jgi:PPOX class probable F420-dependent enzyme